MATRKSSANKPSTSRRSTTPRSTSRRQAGGVRRTTRRRTTRSTSAYRRRRRPGLPTTIGSAIGMLVVTTLLEASWPVRVGLVLAVLVLGLAYLVWDHRAEIAASATPEPEATQTSETPVEQGDPTHD